MYVCIEGCAHGDLEKIYALIESHEADVNKKVDLLICCGDFQATRNKDDLACMAVPLKYLEMGTFYKYYKGELKAPVLTIFIGGNHEASNHLQELAYGGWVAPNIYYLGHAGVIKINGIRFGGISGIYRDYCYRKGHFECPPYNNNTMRSVYYMRNLEVFRMLQLTPSKIHVMLSHDWPQKIWNYGNNNSRFGRLESLLRLKPDFKVDMDNGRLGNPPCFDILMKLRPRYWYSAHMHCRFEALVPHENGESTQFTALDKCIPGRSFFDFFTIGEDVQRDQEGKALLKLEYDEEWLTILSLTNNFLNCSSTDTNLPYEPAPNNSNPPKRWNFTPTAEEIEAVVKKFNDLTLSHNFVQTVSAYDPEWDGRKFNNLKQPQAVLNVQTTKFCEKLNIDDPLLIATKLHNVTVHIPNYCQDDLNDNCNIVSDEAEVCRKKSKLALPKPINSDEIDLDELEDEPTSTSDDIKNVEVDEKKEHLEVQSELNECIQEEDLPPPPSRKKFKRRNQDIYNATDE